MRKTVIKLDEALVAIKANESAYKATFSDAIIKAVADSLVAIKASESAYKATFFAAIIKAAADSFGAKGLTSQQKGVCQPVIDVLYGKLISIARSPESEESVMIKDFYPRLEETCVDGLKNLLSQKPFVFYLDFDGTVTGAEGGRVISSQFYRKLLTSPCLDYKDSKQSLRSPEEIAALFKEHNEELQSNKMLMSAEAVEFFHVVLSRASFDHVSVNIITRNRADYIRAMFKHQGFSDAEIELLNIKDDLFKYIAVQTDLAAYVVKGKYFYVYDDSSSDFTQMLCALRDAEVEFSKLSQGNCAVGGLDWAALQRDISSRLDHHRASIVAGGLFGSSAPSASAAAAPSAERPIGISLGR